MTEFGAPQMIFLVMVCGLAIGIAVLMFFGEDE